MFNDSRPNVCPYPQGRNYIQNSPDSQNARLMKSLQKHPWSTCFQHAWTHKHAPTTPTHTLEQRAYLQSANGEVERERERERVLGRHKVEGGSGVWETKRKRERDKDAPITFALFIAITVAVFWWNKLSHGEGQLQMRSLEYLNGFYQTGKRLNGGILHFFISIFHVVSHWKHPENKMIVLDSCLCLKVGFICFKSAEQPEVQHDFTQEKLI